jgi:hypothetical protein
MGVKKVAKTFEFPCKRQFRLSHSTFLLVRQYCSLIREVAA